MFIPQARRSSRILLDYYGEYALVRLIGQPETAALALQFDKAQDALAGAHKALKKARNELSNAIVARRVAEADLHTAFSAFDLAILMVVGRRRRDANYRRFLPCPIRTFALLPLEMRIEKVKIAEIRLKRADTPPALAQWLPRLTAARESLQRAVAAYADALVAKMLARGTERTERRNWLAGYRIMHADVIRHFAHTPKRVAKFFRAGPRRKKKRPVQATAGA